MEVLYFLSEQRDELALIADLKQLGETIDRVLGLARDVIAVTARRHGRVADQNNEARQGDILLRLALPSPLDRRADSIKTRSNERGNRCSVRRRQFPTTVVERGEDLGVTAFLVLGTHLDEQRQQFVGKRMQCGISRCLRSPRKPRLIMTCTDAPLHRRRRQGARDTIGTSINALKAAPGRHSAD